MTEVKSEGSQYVLVSDFVITDISYECISLIDYDAKLFSSDRCREKQFKVDAPRNNIKLDGKPLKYTKDTLYFLKWMLRTTTNHYNMIIEACTQAIMAHPFYLLQNYLVQNKCIPIDCAGSRLCTEIDSHSLRVSVHKTLKIAHIDNLNEYESGDEKHWTDMEVTMLLPNKDETSVIYLSNKIYS